MPVNRYTTPREGLVAKPLSFEDYTRAGTVRADSLARIAEFTTTDLSYDVLAQDYNAAEQKSKGIETAIGDITKSLTDGALTTSDFDKALSAKREYNNLYGEHGDMTKMGENARVQRAWTAKINELQVTEGWSEAKKQKILEKGNAQFEGSFDPETGAFNEFKPEFTDVINERAFYHNALSQVKGLTTTTLQTLSETDGFKKVKDDSGIGFYVINESNGKRVTNKTQIEAAAEELKSQVIDQDARLGSQLHYFEMDTEEGIAEQNKLIDDIAKQYISTIDQQPDKNAVFRATHTLIDSNKEDTKLPEPEPASTSRLASVPYVKDNFTMAEASKSLNTLADMGEDELKKLQLEANKTGEVPSDANGIYQDFFKPGSVLNSVLTTLGYDVPEMEDFVVDKSFIDADPTIAGENIEDSLQGKTREVFNYKALNEYLKGLKEDIADEEMMYIDEVAVGNTVHKEIVDEFATLSKNQVSPNDAGKNIVELLGNANLIVGEEGAITYDAFMAEGGSDVKIGTPSNKDTKVKKVTASRKGVISGDARFSMYENEFNKRMLGATELVLTTYTTGGTSEKTYYVENPDYLAWLETPINVPLPDGGRKTLQRGGEFIKREEKLSKVVENPLSSVKMLIIDPENPTRISSDDKLVDNYIYATVSRIIPKGKNLIAEDGEEEIVRNENTKGAANFKGEPSETGYVMIKENGERIGIDAKYLRTKDLAVYPAYILWNHQQADGQKAKSVDLGAASVIQQ